MGWANCGDDSKGRPIGYAHAGRCDHAGCKVKIDRGLAYACGGMHGAADDYCEGYFCGAHMQHRYSPTEQRYIGLCEACAKTLDDCQMEEFEGLLKRVIAVDEEVGEFLVDEPKDIELYGEALAAWLHNLSTNGGGFAAVALRSVSFQGLVQEAYDLLTNWEMAGDYDNLPLDDRFMTEPEIKKCTDRWQARQSYREAAHANAG